MEHGHIHQGPAVNKLHVELREETFRCQIRFKSTLLGCWIPEEADEETTIHGLTRIGPWHELTDFCLHPDRLWLMTGPREDLTSHEYGMLSTLGRTSVKRACR